MGRPRKRILRGGDRISILIPDAADRKLLLYLNSLRKLSNSIISIIEEHAEKAIPDTTLQKRKISLSDIYDNGLKE